MPEIQNGLDGLRLLTVRQVADLLNLSIRSIWRMAAEAEAGIGDFPKPLRLGSRTVRWRLADLRAYVDRLGRGGT